MFYCPRQLFMHDFKKVEMKRSLTWGDFFLMNKHNKLFFSFQILSKTCVCECVCVCDKPKIKQQPFFAISGYNKAYNIRQGRIYQFMFPYNFYSFTSRLSNNPISGVMKMVLLDLFFLENISFTFILF